MGHDIPQWTMTKKKKNKKNIIAIGSALEVHFVMIQHPSGVIP
jgi:hypothetical protein